MVYITLVVIALFCVITSLLFIYRCALYTCFYEANEDYYYMHMNNVFCTFGVFIKFAVRVLQDKTI